MDLVTTNALKSGFTKSLLLVAFTFQVSMTYAVETITYFHNDISGSPVAATNTAGTRLWKENYRPYGDRLKKQDDGSNKLWFSGKSFDETTGLSYFGARYYDPKVGRFMGIDPQGFVESSLHSSNRYAYANNNPYKFVDPNGESPVLIVMGIGALVGGGVNAAMQYYATGDVQWGGIGGVFDAAGDGALLGMAGARGAAPKPAPATVDAATAAVTKIPNPYGKAGGPAHQEKISEVVAGVESRGLTAQTGRRIQTPNGSKRFREPDVVGIDQSGKIREIHQVGKVNKNGLPVSREVKAASDIKDATGLATRYHPYNKSTN